MKNQFLFPSKFKKPALFFLILSLSMGMYMTFVNDTPGFLRVKVYDVETGLTGFGYFRYFMEVDEYTTVEQDQLPSKNKYEDLGNTLVGSILILSLLIFAFSREKNEDEYIQKIRLDSLVWATYINYGLLFIAFFIFWSFSFLSVMIYNMFTHLLIFVIRFNYYKIKMNRSLKHEE